MPPTRPKGTHSPIRACRRETVKTFGGANNGRTLWTRWRTDFPGHCAGYFPVHPQSTSHWEVPEACYSPSLTVRSGRGQPTFKGGVTLPEHMDAMSSMFITHLNLKCHVSGRVTIPQWHLWWVKACLCPRYPKKNRPMVKKIDNQSIKIN